MARAGICDVIRTYYFSLIQKAKTQYAAKAYPFRSGAADVVTKRA
jgi:hypothetical protein